MLAAEARGSHGQRRCAEAVALTEPRRAHDAPAVRPRRPLQQRLDVRGRPRDHHFATPVPRRAEAAHRLGPVRTPLHDLDDPSQHRGPPPSRRPLGLDEDHRRQVFAHRLSHPVPRIAGVREEDRAHPAQDVAARLGRADHDRARASPAASEIRSPWRSRISAPIARSATANAGPLQPRSRSRRARPRRSARGWGTPPAARRAGPCAKTRCMKAADPSTLANALPRTTPASSRGAPASFNTDSTATAANRAAASNLRRARRIQARVEVHGRHRVRRAIRQRRDRRRAEHPGRTDQRRARHHRTRGDLDAAVASRAGDDRGGWPPAVDGSVITSDRCSFHRTRTRSRSRPARAPAYAPRRARARRRGPGSGSSSPAVGTSMPRAATSAVIAASTPPAAPRPCPIWPLLLETGDAAISRPSTRARAATSVASLRRRPRAVSVARSPRRAAIEPRAGHRPRDQRRR